jgi:hypothetical protein
LLQPEVQRGVKEKIQKSHEEQKICYDVKSKDLTWKEGDVIPTVTGEIHWLKESVWKQLEKRSLLSEGREQYIEGIEGNYWPPRGYFPQMRKFLQGSYWWRSSEAEKIQDDLKDSSPALWLNDYV